MSQTAATPPEQPSGKTARERSPSFPYISLAKAIERATLIEAQHKQNATLLPVVAKTLTLGPKSSALLQTAATLKAYGLIDGEGAGKGRKIKISELARRIIHDTRPGVRAAAIKEAALKPKLIAEFAGTWNTGRPDDAYCISELKLDRGFTEEAAKAFLRVFDETIKFANLAVSDKKPEENSMLGEAKTDLGGHGEAIIDPPPSDHKPPPPAQHTVKVMESERVVFTEESQPHQYLKLIASGSVDDGMLEALEDFVRRQRKRLKSSPATNMAN